MTEAWQSLREKALGLSNDEDIRAIGQQMQQTAQREDTSVWVISTVIALAAFEAGVKLSQANIADFYRSSLAEIRSNGLPAYYSRVSDALLGRGGQSSRSRTRNLCRANPETGSPAAHQDHVANARRIPVMAA